MSVGHGCELTPRVSEIAAGTTCPPKIKQHVRKPQRPAFWALMSVLIALQYVDDRGDRIPIACGGRHPEKLVHRAEIADHLHVAPVEPEGKSIFHSQDS